MQCQPEAFEQARRHIRPEFLSGNPQIDAITYISVTGSVQCIDEFTSLFTFYC